MALPLPEALEQANQRGYDVRVVPTVPPRETANLEEGVWRVARVKPSGTTLEMVVVGQITIKEVNPHGL